MKINLTDRALFNVFVLTAPLILFLNVISFDVKNGIGGIGTNLFVVVLAFLSLMSVLRRKRIESGMILLAAILIFIVAKSLLRSTVSFSVSDLIVITKSFSFFLLHYYLGVTYLDSEHARLKALKAIAWFTVVAAIIGIIHFHFLYRIPFIDLNYATSEYGAVLYLKDPDLMRFRESSIFFGPNVFAYMLVFGYICYYQARLVKIDLGGGEPMSRVILVTLLIGYGLVLSDSRSALFLMFIFIVANVMRQNSGLLIRIVVPIGIIAAAALLLLFSQRFSLALALSDPRFVKLFVAYTLLSQNQMNWIIGLPAGSAWDAGDVAFSDNLYGALLLEGGLVLVLLLAIFAKQSTRKINFLMAKVSASDARFLVAAKYSLIFFLFYGLFAIPTSMTTLFNYLGLLLGGVSRIMMQRNRLNIKNV